MLRKNNIVYRLLLVVAGLLLLPTGVRGNIVITQIMYDTPLNEVITQPPYSNGEFVELYNASPLPVDMSAWSLCGGGKTEKYAFPEGTTVPPEGYIVVAYRHKNTPLFALDSLYQDVPKESDAFRTFYQRKLILSNTGEDIVLRNAEGLTIDSIFYDGTSNKRKANRLSADNEDNTDSISDTYTAQVDIHRTIQRIRVGTNHTGGIVADNAHWETKPVTFAQAGMNFNTLLPADFYYWKDTPIADFADNYVVSVQPLDISDDVSIEGSHVYAGSGARTQVTYACMDALGRQVRQVGRRATPDCQDLVTQTEYLPSTGTTRQWLPVAVGKGMQATKEELQAIATDYYNDAAPFSTLTKEQTSSARPLSVQQTGETWQNHSATADYGVNQANEVQRWLVTAEGIEQDGYYPVATLRSQTQTDADGRLATTYTDEAGNVVLLRMADGALTYRIYDDMDRLRYILPPAAMTQLPQGAIAANDSILRTYAYTYRYDRRGNLIYKRLPGCEPVCLVYDGTGRAVLSQDGNQRERGDYWTVFKYDSLGRIAYISEVLADNETHEEKMQLFEEMTVVESFSVSGQNNPMGNTGYSRNYYHVQPTKLLTVSYYDNYDFLQLLPPDTLAALTYEENTPYGKQYENATGLLTGNRVYSLEDSLCTITAYYYDKEGRVIQQRSITHTGSSEITYTAYNFDGTVKRTLHELDGTTECYLYTYDHAGRPIKTLYTLDDDKATLLAENHYNSIGQLTEKIRHNGQDTICYRYDIRGALTELRNGDFSERLYYADSLPEGATASYTGNIAAAHITNGDISQQWHYNYDERNRLTEASLMRGTAPETAEQFTYDDMGNLLTLKRYSDEQLTDDLDYHYKGNQVLHIADYAGTQDSYDLKEYHGEEAGQDEAMRYDANGNLIYDPGRQICVIRYNLLNLPDTIQFMNGNQIVNVYDAAGRKLRTTSYTQVEALATPATQVLQLEYTLGKVTETTITYNGNQQTTTILQNRVHAAKKARTTYIYNAEGYVTKFTVVTKENPSYTYHYYRRDHLGNHVAVWDATGDITKQRTFFYATGMPMSCSTSRSSNRYTYNGKEYVEEHGLDVYDYGFRGYYATIGRFTSIDPLAEQTPWQSPYVYANNNFINNVDLWGLAAAGNVSSFHINLPRRPLHWVAIDEDGNVVGWGDDEGDEFVYLVDDDWDGSYGGLGGYDIIGWEIDGFRNYTIGQPCYYTGAFTRVEVGKSGWHVIGYERLMYGNEPAPDGDDGSWVFGALSNGIGLANNLTCNELYWIGKNGKFYTRNLRHKQGGWAYSYKVAKQSKPPILGKLGGVMSLLSILEEGQQIWDTKTLQTSNIINIVLAAASFTGVGALVAAGYFIIDTGVLLATSSSLNDYIDNLTGPIVKW